MTAQTEERALLAVAALIAELRTANGYATEVGARVLLSHVFAELDDADPDWLTLIYTASETYGSKPDSEDGIVGNQRAYQLGLTIHIDAHRRIDALSTAQHAAQIKADVRRAMLPQSGRLLLDGVLVGAIRYLGNELIPDALQRGVLGVRSRVRVVAQETITNA